MDCQSFLADDPDEETHNIVVDNPLDPSELLVVPLVLKGVTSNFPVMKPTALGLSF